MTRVKRQLSLLMILSLLFSMIGLESYAEYRTLSDRKVASDKVFVIRFNDIIDRSNLNPDSIRVQGEEGDVAVSIENGSDGRSLIVQPPAEGYAAGKTYTLIIQHLTNNNGKMLKQSVQMKFRIEEQEEKKQEEATAPVPAPSVPSSPGSGGGSGGSSAVPLPPAVSNPDPAPSLPAPLPPVLPDADAVLPSPLPPAPTEPEPVPPSEPPTSSDSDVSVPETESESSDPNLSDAASEQPAPPEPETSGSASAPLESPSDGSESSAVPSLPDQKDSVKEEPPASPAPAPNDDVSTKESEKDSAAAEAALAALKSGVNKNAVQYTVLSGRETGKVRNVLWVKGITAPELSEFREVKDGSYVVRQINYQSGKGWYDVNKSKDGKHKVNDDYLCFAAVASNMVHWWMEQNDEDIQAYIEQQKALVNEPPSNTHLTEEKIEMLQTLRNSFTNQQDSEIFRKFTREFGHLTQGFQADLLVDMLINGYSPKVNSGLNDDNYPPVLEALANNIDSRGGLFYPIFGGKKVTDRFGSVGNYEQFGRLVKRQMSQGNLIGLVYQTLGKSAHIVTVWGAEFDLKGQLVAVYISDSDDQNEGTNVGMKRLEIRNVDNRPRLGSDQSNLRAGARIDHIHVMLSGEGLWKK